VSDAEVFNDGNIAKEIAYDPHMRWVLGGGLSINVIDGHATARQFAAAALSAPRAVRATVATAATSGTWLIAWSVPSLIGAPCRVQSWALRIVGL
jgi:hypothetical protein